MSIIINDDCGLTVATVIGGTFRGDFEALCKARALIEEKIVETELEATTSPEDYLPTPP